jgi:integrase
MRYQQFEGIFVGTSESHPNQIPTKMALTDTFVKSVKSTSKSGEKHSDGGGLYLLVKESGKYWRMNYRFGGKQKTLALGVYPTVSLKVARDKREKAKEQLAAGEDPSIEKRKSLAAKFEASQNTFEVVARAWLKKSQADRVASTQGKVTTWLEKDVIPHIGKFPIADIRPRDVLGALRHMERRGALESVQRVKQICGQVFRFAVAEGSVERDVTQDLKGALEKHKAGHHPAITDPKQTGELMRAIYGYTGTPYTVAAIKLLPLVFVRPGELRTAEWAEIDLEAAQWRIPAVKMKMKVDHLVPLSTQALEILQGIKSITGNGKYVFPSIRTGERPMSENTINGALRAMGYAQHVHTAHGFRAMARTILDEVLDQRVDLIEHQLAHKVKDANGTAYNRTAHLPARVLMMQTWADYLEKLRIGGEVIQLRGAA